MNTLIATIAAYLIGSISFAVVMSRAFGLSDPRTYGSKNPGATNVLRSGSKKAAIATLADDFDKLVAAIEGGELPANLEADLVAHEEAANSACGYVTVDE